MKMIFPLTLYPDWYAGQTRPMTSTDFQIIDWNISIRQSYEN